MFKSHGMKSGRKLQIPFLSASILKVSGKCWVLSYLWATIDLKTNIKISLLVFIFLSFWGIKETLAQSQKRVIQLSGVVLDQDSVMPLPGVHVYVPKAGRGTSTNGNGFFSMPVLVGDSVVISSIGYQRQFYIV